MFGKYGFRVRTNFILNTKFNYDPRKLAPAQRDIYTRIINGCYSDNGKPVDAAIMFMLVQANTLTGESRKGPFVERICSVVDQLQCQMSPQANAQLQDWTADFIAESDRQDADTQDETIKRHFERVLTATTHNAGHGASRDSLLEAMEHVHVVWKHMIGNEILRPRELAIVFGMMDSLGQAFGAKVDATQEAMGSVLGHTNLILYLAAGRDPTLLSWVMAGGRAVWELYVDKKKAPEEVIEALAKQYLADIQERPDVVPHI